MDIVDDMNSFSPGKTAPRQERPGALTLVEDTFGNVHELLGTLETVISNMVGEATPRDTDRAETAPPAFSGQFGAVADQARGVNERVNYMRDRINFLARSAA